MESGRCSAVVVISHIFLFMTMTSWLIFPPFSLSNAKLLCCLSEYGLKYPGYCEELVANVAAFNFSTFIMDFFFSRDHSFMMTAFDIRQPNPILRPPSLSWVVLKRNTWSSPLYKLRFWNQQKSSSFSSLRDTFPLNDLWQSNPWICCCCKTWC